MSYSKRQFQPRIISVIDRNGSPLYPHPVYRCEDRHRRLPEGHPMAIRNVTPAPPLAHQHYLIVPPAPLLRGDLSSRVCAVMAIAGGVGVVFGLMKMAGWL